MIGGEINIFDVVAYTFIGILGWVWKQQVRRIDHVELSIRELREENIDLQKTMVSIDVKLDAVKETLADFSERIGDGLKETNSHLRKLEVSVASGRADAKD